MSPLHKIYARNNQRVKDWNKTGLPTILSGFCVNRFKTYMTGYYQISSSDTEHVEWLI
jgi:hypothetical protein